MATDTSVVFNILAKDKATGAMKQIGAAAGAMFSAFAVTRVFDFGKDAIKSASDLAETQSKVNVIFGKGAGQIDTWGASADKALGQSQQQALDAAATFAIFGKSAGLQGPALASFSTGLTGLATDMASFSNTSPQEAIDAIGSALRGESDPIEKYGVLLNESVIQQEALRMGLIKTTKQALTPQQRVLAAQSSIIKQTSAAHGDFARTSGGLANKQRIMAAEFENAKTKLGAGLLPIMLKFVSSLMSVIGFVEAHQSWLAPLAIGIGVIAVAIWAATTAQTAWNIAMSLNPIGLIIIAVIALVAVFIYLWTHSAAFRDFFIGLWNHIWGFLKAIGGWFAGPFAHFFIDTWNWLVRVGVAVVTDLIKKWNSFKAFIFGIPGAVRHALFSMWDGLKDGFKAAINFVIRGWNRLHFRLPSFDTHIPGVGVVGGFNVGLPQLPLLDVGGDVLRAGLAVIHQGERVVPAAQVRALPAGGGGGQGGRGATVRFLGNTDTAFATAFRRLVRDGIIQIDLD